MAALSYREYPPPADLARWIACFWHIGGAVAQSSGFSHRVLPDGCADLLFDLLGVRLRPGAVATFVGIAADQLLDITAPIVEAPASLRVDAAQLADLPDC